VTQVTGTWCGFGEVAVVREWNPISAGVLRPLLILSSSLSWKKKKRKHKDTESVQKGLMNYFISEHTFVITVLTFCFIVGSNLTAIS